MKIPTKNNSAPAILLAIVSVMLWLAPPVSAALIYSNAGPLSVAGDGVTVMQEILPGTNFYRDDTSSDTVYFSYTVVNPPGPFDSGYFSSGMQLAVTNSANNTDTQSLYVGKTFYDWVYDAYAPSLYNATNYNGADIYLDSADPEPGETYQYIRDSDVTTIIFRVKYNPGALDNVTVFLNPDLTQSEFGQSTNLITTFSNNCSFNELEMLNINFDDGTTSGGPGSGVWVYSNVAIATNAVDIGFAPEPAVQIARVANGVSISWTGSTAVLQEAPSVLGPWINSANQTNPQIRAATNTALFFRLQL